MNFLAPDVVALGNHEFDYGLPHLLFLEKMANFPIVNANLYIKKYQKRLMKPYHVINKAGFDIMFTGILTEKVIDSLNMDKLVSSFVSLEEASGEVGKICNSYKNDDIDLTVLLTHIGFDSDKALAAMLKPEWGVDLIIGGHSHTVLDKPERINNILIAQAGTGTNQIGRFDIVVDDDTNSIIDYRWQAITVTSKLVKPDQNLTKYIDSFKKVVDRKYNIILTRFAKQLTHPKREVETTLGNLIADIFAETAQCDIMLVGAGSIRVKELGPTVTLSDVMSCFPYDDNLTRFTITGSQVKKIFNHIMRPENRDGEGECYQVSSGIKAIYDEKTKKLLSISFKEKPIEESKNYTICLQGYHVNQAASYLSVSETELRQSGPAKVVATSGQEVIKEYLRTHQNLNSKIEGRLNYL
jgi:5'-nucleotidase